MKYRKGSVTDVIWFIAVITMFIIVMRMQLEYSNIATIDSYAKNIVNTEATRFVSSIAGYAVNSTDCNMYDEAGNKKSYSEAMNTVSNAKNNMINNIQDEFANNTNLSTRTKGISASNVDVSMKEKTGKSTIVTVTVRYTVVGSNYDGKSGVTSMSNFEIPRKVVVTRIIENPLRFK